MEETGIPGENHLSVINFCWNRTRICGFVQK